MSQFIRFKIHRLCLIFLLLVVTVGCDQMTKVLARDVLENQAPISYWNHSVVFEHAENPGAFLNLGAELDHSLRFWIFTVAVATFLLGSLIFLIRNLQLSTRGTIAWSLVVGGGLGNLWDRIEKGTVTDFINLGIQHWRTGIFNVADVAIMLGILMLLLDSWKKTSGFSLRPGSDSPST